MIHTRNATLIHFKQSKLPAESIIDQQKRGLGYSNVCAKLFSPFLQLFTKINLKMFIYTNEILA